MSKAHFITLAAVALKLGSGEPEGFTYHAKRTKSVLLRLGVGH
ncbi:MAG: hypothetical protein PHG10_10040 [Sulfurimonas sp.]|nr:hypothetical protein [Sulfurimonas sp.]